MESLNIICGEKRIPGIVGVLYLICACDVLTFPALKTTTGIGDSITLDGNIVPKIGKRFAKLLIITDTGEVIHTGVGERSGQNLLNEISFKVIKTIAADEWFNRNINADVVAIMQDKNRVFRVLGSKDVPARFSGLEGKTGITNESESNWSAKITDTNGSVAPVYEGSIPTEILMLFSTGENATWSSGINIKIK